GNDISAVRLKRADLPGQVRGQIFDALERLALAVETGRLQAEERLAAAQVLRERAIAEDVAVVSGDGENRSPRSVRLQRYDGPLLPGQRPGRAQECQDIALTFLQFLAQFGGERAGGSITAQ